MVGAANAAADARVARLRRALPCPAAAGDAAAAATAASTTTGPRQSPSARPAAASGVAAAVDAAAAVFVVDNNVSLSANEKEQVLTEPLIMKESEALKVQASSGQTDVIASILEINREDR